MSVELQRILGIKKLRKTKFDPKTAKPATLEWHVVMRFVLGEIKRVDAIREFIEELGYKEHSAERYVDQLKPRVEEFIKTNPEYVENYGSQN